MYHLINWKINLKDINGKTILHFACESENLVKYIVSLNQIDINSMAFYIINNDRQQNSVLHIATEKENVEIVKLLLENDKTDVNTKH